MKKWIFIGLAVLLVSIALTGCGDNDADPVYIAPDTTITHILSDRNADGDISLSFDGSTMTISQAVNTNNVWAGVDPTNGDEIRGFLDFPLGGNDGVPEGAQIFEATLELTINHITVASGISTIPMLIELVSFQPPEPLVANHFYTDSQPSILIKSFTFFTSDAGKIVPIDVTALMDEVQRLNLPDFQVRLRMNFSASAGDGMIEIIDDRFADTAPLLTVEYY